MTSSAAAGVTDGRNREVGMITADPSPTLIALIAHEEIDFLVLDAEQTSLTVQRCAEVVQSLAGSRTKVAVRVPELDELTLVSFANTGVDEIVLPRITQVSQLESAWHSVRFPPLGCRPKQASFASKFGQDFSTAPRLTVLFETVEAVAAVDDFVTSEFFDGGWVGPSDLAQDLALIGRSGSDELRIATQTVLDALVAAGHSVGLPAPSIARVAEVHERGVDRVAIYWERELASIIRDFSAIRGLAPRANGGRNEATVDKLM